MMTLVACKAGWGESTAMALVWVSGVGPCRLTQLMSAKLKVDNEAEHIACMVDMAICALIPGNLACWPTSAYMLTHAGTSM